MNKRSGAWREVMTDAEREEMDRALKMADTAREHLRAVTKKLKDRCIKRMRRAQKGEE